MQDQCSLLYHKGRTIIFYVNNEYIFNLLVIITVKEQGFEE